MLELGELVWVGRDGSDRVEHIARHGVSVRDVFGVVYEGQITHRWESERLRLYGQNRGGDYLLVILEPLGDDRWLVITARRADDDEKRELRKRVRR